MPAPAQYQRGSVTWLLFAGLLAFGFLNAVLGPALPYLRAVEHISYIPASLHQVAFAIGGGSAGLLAAWVQQRLSRRATIRLGLGGAALAALGVAYGGHLAVTIVAAMLMSLLGTSALVRMWAALADEHGARRAVAMSEGEVSVSFGGIVAPLLIGALAATALTWRFAFVLGAAGIAGIVVMIGARRFPPSPGARPGPAAREPGLAEGGQEPVATLVVTFAIVALEFSLSFWLASYLHDAVGIDRGVAVGMVSGLYLANLLGRLITSRLARRHEAAWLLAGALVLALAGLPFLLAAHGAAPAAVGIAITGAGIGAMFPLTSSLHVAVSPRTSDAAIGQLLFVAAAGQICGPLAAGAIAQAGGLRAGLLVAPALVVLAGGALFAIRPPAGRPARA